MERPHDDVSDLHSVASLIEESLALERAAEWGAALQTASQALSLARDLGDPQDIAQALMAVARYRFRLGQYKTARSLAEEALAADIARLWEEAKAAGVTVTAQGARSIAISGDRNTVKPGSPTQRKE